MVKEPKPMGPSAKWQEVETKPLTNFGCDRCDGPGGKNTYENQAAMPINGKVRFIDWCIHHIVAALNAGGVETVACCCGHGEREGRIDLADGRVLRIEQPTHE